MPEETSSVADSAVRTVHSDDRQSRLHRTLAWVGIVAGIVFTVAVIFFSGFILGRANGYHGWHHYQGGQGGGCPMMQQGGIGGKGGGMMRPGGMMDPEDMGPGMMGPGMMGPGPMPSPKPKPPS